MWTIRTSLDLYGNKLSPKALLKDITEAVHVTLSNEPDDINERDPSGIFGFGSIDILSPRLYGLEDEIADYNDWYFDFIDKYKSTFDQHGVTTINLFIEVFHNGGQLNFEIFSRELLQKVGLYNIAIPISYYRLTNEQMIDLLQSAGIDQETIQFYIDRG